MPLARLQDAPCTLNAPTTPHPSRSFRFQIFNAVAPSAQGSAKTQSRVGRPGNDARSTLPLGNTSLRSNAKSCLPGASETYTGHPPTARAAAWSAPASPQCDWNMSQSGVTISPMKTELYATLATCTVWLARFVG